jgi:uncharacterized protein YlxP (DUF503 family)
MTVGACRITLRLPENDSLKGKRQLVKSVASRVRNKYNVSIAEVGDNESWQIVSLGVSCVSNSVRHADEMLTKVVKFIAGSRLEAELLDYEMEMLQAL